MQRARDQGKVRRTSSALRPVNTRVHGPGPVGSAANIELKDGYLYLKRSPTIFRTVQY